MLRTITLCVLLLLVSMAAAEEEEAVKLTDPKLGEFWFRMQDPEGGPQGYCRLTVTRQGDGGLDFFWELHLGFSGGSYEEERNLSIGADRRLVSCSMKISGEFLSEGRREGDRIKGKAKVEGELKEIDLAIPDDVLSSLSFVVAAMMPLDEGTKFSFPELNESKGFEPAGTATATVGALEKLEGEDGEVEARKVDLEREGMGTLPIWVTADRRIQQVDWGGGNLMSYSARSTKHLFKPGKPAVTQVETGPEKLVVTGGFEKFTPRELYDHFTKAELLTKWWPPEAEVELKEGGNYTLIWGDTWKLIGKVVAFDPGKRFVFTWAWEHAEADAPTRTVEVVFEPADGGGARLTLTHGDYGDDPQSVEARAGHLQGWEMFLTKLKELRKE